MKIQDTHVFDDVHLPCNIHQYHHQLLVQC